MIDRDRTYSQLARLAASDFADIVDDSKVVKRRASHQSSSISLGTLSAPFFGRV